MKGFPDILLPEVLDYLELEDLLLSAMPVNRFWRRSVIDHPRYWQDIALDEDGPHERSLRSASLFMLRLERAGAKPVDLRIWMMDPTAVLGALTRNIHHIRRFTVCTLVRRSDSLFHSLRDAPAPILEHLDIDFRDEPESEDAIVMLPAVLFALKAPVLTEVAFTNCALPSDDALPEWLSNVAKFSYQNPCAPPGVHQLPNVFASWSRLRDLRLGGPMELDNPAFLQASTWAGLEFLGLDGELAGALTALPLARIPRIELTDAHIFSPDHIAFIASTLMDRGPLHLALRAGVAFYLGDDMLPIAEARVALQRLSDADAAQPTRTRELHGYMPPGKPAHFVSAFQRAPLLARIASVAVALHSWDHLVGAGHLARFPAAETLALTLRFAEWEGTWRAPARSAATLALPRLRWLVLRYDQDGPPDRRPVLQLSDLAEFVAHQLSGVQLPLRLSLEGVEVQGVPEEFSGVFCT